MKRLTFAVIVWVALAAPAWADLQQGIAALARGDYAISFREFKRLAEQGDGVAAMYLSRQYSIGRGVRKDESEAVRWKHRAAERIPEAAEQGDALSQGHLGTMYLSGGWGFPEDQAEAVKWYRRGAEQGDAYSLYRLGELYWEGKGVLKDQTEALNLYRRSAEQGNTQAQQTLGGLYSVGSGVLQDYAEALKWRRMCAEAGRGFCQLSLGNIYKLGYGVAPDAVVAHAWYNLATVRGLPFVSKVRDRLARQMTPDQIARAQELARNWRPGRALVPPPASRQGVPRQFGQKKPTLKSAGTGFVVSRNGHVLTNNHVVTGCREVRVRSLKTGNRVARVVAQDSQNDLALLKLQSRTKRVATFRQGRGIRQGDGVIVIGFPLPGVLASNASLTTGTVSALAGPQDDIRLLQITAPVQRGNSGGPLLDYSGNVVGVIVSKLDAIAVARQSGDIPQNVNFAINARIAQSFLEANAVDYDMALSKATLKPAQIAVGAKAFTLPVECWK